MTMEQPSIERLAEHYDTHSQAEAVDRGTLVTEPTPDPMIVLSVWVPRAAAQRLRQAAARHQTKPTELIREWLLDRLEADEHASGREQLAAELEQFARRLRAST